MGLVYLYLLNYLIFSCGLVSLLIKFQSLRRYLFGFTIWDDFLASKALSIDCVLMKVL